MRRFLLVLALVGAASAQDGGDAAAHRDRGEALAKQGKLDEARGEFEKARERYLEAKDAALAAAMLGKIGEILTGQRAYADAAEVWKRYADEQASALGGDHPDVAAGLNNAAYCLLELGRARDALPLHQSALAIRQRLYKEDHPAVAQSLNNVAWCLEAVGRYEDAIEVHEEALAMYRRLNAGDNLDVARGLARVGGCLEHLGRAADALPFLEESLAMRQRLFRPPHVELATGLNDLAVCRLMLGSPADALPLFEESLSVYRRLFEGDHPWVATALRNVASCLAELGRVEEAVSVHEESLAIWRRLFGGDHPRVAQCLNSVAFCRWRLGHAADALALFEEALATWKRLFEGDHPDVASSLNNVATCLFELGRAGEALPLYEASLAMAQRLYDSDDGRVATSLSNLAECLWDLGRAAEAVRAFEAATKAARRTNDPGRHRNLAILAGVLLEAGDATRAAELAGEAVDQIESLRGAAMGLTEADRARYFAALKRFGAFTHSIRALRALGRDAEALHYVERLRARSFLDLLDRSRLDALAEVRVQAEERGDKETVEMIARVTADLDGAEAEVGRATYRLAALRPTGQEPEERQAAICKASAELAAARGAEQEALRRRSRLIGAQLRAAAPADAAALQRLAGPDGRVLVYSVGEEATTLFVVPPPGSSIRAMDLLWPDGARVTAKRLAQRVEEHARRIDVGREGGRGIAAPEKRGGSWGAGHGLFRSLVPGDIWTDLRKAKIVHVVADGALQRLAFESLPIDEGGTAFWIDHGPPLVYGPSGSALLWSREQGDRQRSQGRLGEVVVLGDPVFARGRAEATLTVRRSSALSRYGELAPLPGTRREAEAVAKVLGSPEPPPLKVTLLLGEDATAPNLRRAAPRARYLHIATHGLSDETELASYSSLALTLPAQPTAEDDGFLSLADVLAGWRGALARCELVVLSACETQRGHEQRDEGVYALPVGFLYAGAPSVIGSLWRVDDASTAELFADFYGRLRGSGGREKLLAFTEARKALKKKHPEPYFWAPFVYVGDPR